jgi:hypothetical protein
MKLKPGELVELQVNANFIPAGRYHFKREEDDMIILQVAEESEIGLSSHFWKPFLKPVSDLNSRPTTINEFLVGYLDALGKGSSPQLPASSGGDSYCSFNERHLPRIQERIAQKGNFMKNAW